METEVKVLHIENKKTRDGKPYQVFFVIVTINGKNFFRKFYDFGD